MLRSVALLASVAFGDAFVATRSFAPAGNRVSHVSMSTIADFEATKLDGSKAKLSDFAGKPTLVVNVASL